MPVRLKIVQIEAVYQQFTDSLYAKWPGLHALGFETQIKTILDSGWSGGQNVVPSLNPSAWERYYIIPKLIASQLAWARQKGIPESHWNLREILSVQLQTINPDVIYLSDLGSFDFSILDELKRRPLVVAWLASRFPPGFPWTKVDLLLSGISAIRDEALRKGVRAVENFNSAAPSFRSSNSGSERREGGPVKIGFSGSFFGGYHDDRAKLFVKLAYALPEVSVNLYTGQPYQLPEHCPLHFFEPVFAADVVDTYASHDIVVDARADFGLGETRFNRDTSNMRIFEATRAGSLLITEYAPNLEEMFEIGDEILCFRSEEELFELASHYGNSRMDNTRRIIATAGFNRVLACHTIEHRAAEFDLIVQRSL